MIQALELRIGNWLLFDDGEHLSRYVQVAAINVDGFSAVGDHVYPTEEDCKYNIEPIPLTPELLQKAGFKWVSSIYRWKHDCGYEIIRHDFGFENGLGNGSFRQPSLKHLHQLQNLYFALTGEELTIDLP